MKAYVPRYSFRPGCNCCNNSTLHGYHGRMNPSKNAAKRSGKKAMRRIAKAACKVN